MATREIKRNRSKQKINYSKHVLVVFRSNKNITAQVLAPESKKVLFSVSSSKLEKGTKTEKSHEVGNLIAKKIQESKITEIVADRNGYLYHGRVKALFEAVRSAGINI